MRALIIGFAAVLAVTAWAKEPERIPAAEGQTIVKEFYSDGTIKTITRLQPNGSLLCILYHTPKGVPTHVDFYYQKRVRRRVFYREDGTPKTAKEFDQRGKVIFEDEDDKNGHIIKRRAVK